MKLLARSVFGLLMVLAVGIAGTAEATPVYYTFTGQIESAYDWSAGGISVSSIGGISVGQTVAWTLVADTSLAAYYTAFGVYNGPFGPPYFYTAFVSGDTLGPVTGSDYLPYDYHYGHPTGFFVGTPHPDQSYNYVEIDFPSLAGLLEGQSGFYGQNHVIDLGTDGSGLVATVSSANFTLTSISDIAPIPEPGTVALLGAGLLGLVALRRRPA